MHLMPIGYCLPASFEAEQSLITLLWETLLYNIITATVYNISDIHCLKCIDTNWLLTNGWLRKAAWGNNIWVTSYNNLNLVFFNVKFVSIFVHKWGGECGSFTGLFCKHNFSTFTNVIVSNFEGCELIHPFCLFAVVLLLAVRLLYIITSLMVLLWYKVNITNLIISQTILMQLLSQKCKLFCLKIEHF